MGIMSLFDHNKGITKVDVTPGYTNQTTGAWVAAVEVESSIVGHLSDMSLQELKYLDPAIVADGVRKFSCESTVALVPEDKIKVVEMDGTTTTWLVVSKLNASSLLSKHVGISRETFLLRRQT